jgi:hypothetical protein
MQLFIGFVAAIVQAGVIQQAWSTPRNFLVYLEGTFTSLKILPYEYKERGITLTP